MCCLAIDIRDTVGKLPIPHIPTEYFQLRIGLHTGGISYTCIFISISRSPASLWQYILLILFSTLTLYSMISLHFTIQSTRILTVWAVPTKLHLVETQYSYFASYWYECSKVMHVRKVHGKLSQLGEKLKVMNLRENSALPALCIVFFDCKNEAIGSYECKGDTKDK